MARRQQTTSITHPNDTHMSTSVNIYLARYSFIQLSQLGHHGENKNAQSWNR